MELEHPNDPRLIFEAEFHEGEPATGEYKYSLGDPPRPPWWEITAVAWLDGKQIVDITEFVAEYADNLFPKWEEELIEQIPNP